MMACLQPKPGETVADPACGTGGFLLAAHEWVAEHHITEMDADDKRFLRDEAVQGWEIVPGTARLCAMNLLLHGIGTASGESLVIAVELLAAHQDDAEDQRPRRGGVARQRVVRGRRG